MSQAYVNISVREGVGEVVFFHPSGNSLPGEILNRIAAGILELGQDAEVKVIVLKSDGAKAFCAGASFDELMAIDNEEKGKVFFSGCPNLS